MAKRKRIPGVSPDEVLSAAQESTFGLENLGFCVLCGAEAHGVEPDARKYPCEECERRGVYGASELVLMGYAE